MNVFYKKYKRLSGLRVCDEIIDFFKSLDKDFKMDKYSLTDDQIRQLRYYWGDDTGMYGDHGLPFQAYMWKKQESKGSWLRITFPFFVVFVILMTLIVRPVHWLLTGNWWFGDKSKLEDFIARWYVSIFGE
jgi:hypothetical protein